MRNPLRFLFFVYIAISSAIFVGWATYLTIIVASHPLQLLLSLVFLVIAVVMGLLNLLMGYLYYASATMPRNDKGCKLPAELPTVAVCVACCNEDPAIVSETVESIRTIKYPSSKVQWWLLDSSEKPEIRKDISTIASRNGFHYLYRDRHRGFKAGSLNELVQRAKGAEFIAIFDADEKVSDDGFLMDNIGFFYKDEKLAFVQTTR